MYTIIYLLTNWEVQIKPACLCLHGWQTKQGPARTAILWQQYSTKNRMHLLCSALLHQVVGQGESLKLHLCSRADHSCNQIFLHKVRQAHIYASIAKLCNHSWTMCTSYSANSASSAKTSWLFQLQSVYSLVADKLERQCMVIWEVGNWKAAAQFIFQPQLHWQLSEHTWKSHYKCSSRLQ